MLQGEMNNSNYSKNLDWRVIVRNIFPRKDIGEANDAVMTISYLTEDACPFQASEYTHPVIRLQIISTYTNDILGCHKEFLNVRIPKNVEIGIARVSSP